MQTRKFLKAGRGPLHGCSAVTTFGQRADHGKRDCAAPALLENDR